MSDPINGISRGHIPVPLSTGKSTGSSKSASSTKTGETLSGRDAVSLTNAAETLQELEKTLSADATISSERIDAIKSSLSSGNYQINPDLIAEKFIDVERALGKVTS